MAAAALIVVTTALAYSNVPTSLVAYNDRYHEAGYTYDNKHIIRNDPRMRASLWAGTRDQPGLVDVFTRDYWWATGISGLYRPVVTFSYWLNQHVIGGDETSLDPALDVAAREEAVARIRHRRFLSLVGANVLAHAAAAVLVYFAALLVTGRFWTSGAIAALFGVHPIGVEAVTNAVGRADIFATITVLGGLLLYARAMRSEGRGRIPWLAGLMLLSAWGVFSKESAATVGFVIVLYDVLYRVRPGGLHDFSRPRLAEMLKAAARVLLYFCLFFFWWRMTLDGVLPRLNALIPAGHAVPDWSGAPPVYVLLLAVWCVAAVSLHAVPLVLPLRPRGRAVLAMLLLPCLLALGVCFSGTTAALWSWGFAGASTLLAIWEIRMRPPAALAIKAPGWRGLVDGYLVFIPVAVAMICIRSAVFGATTPPEAAFLDNPILALNPIATRLTAFGVVVRLWKILAFPFRLSCDYSFNQVPPFGSFGSWAGNLFDIISAILVLGTIALGLWLWMKGRQRAAAFFILFFFVTFLPTSNLVRIISSIMAERFVYLPMVGFLGCLVLAVEWLARRVSQRLRPDREGREAVTQLGALAVLGALCLAYGTRTFARNFDWRSDVALWTATLRTSPRSFRAHESYAFALFEELKKPPDQRQPAARDVTIDQVIAAADEGRAIVDPLPDRLNGTRLYQDLGTYYVFKGDLLSRRGPGGERALTDESRSAYEASIEVLKRALPIDREFNETNRRLQVERGMKPEEVPDVGYRPLYETLGYSFMQLGRFEDAVKATLDLLHLDPTDPEAYLKLASVHMGRDDPEEVAVALYQALTLDGSRRELWPVLTQYLRRVDPEPGPAVGLGPDGQERLDLRRKAVRQVVCSASHSFARLFLDSKIVSMAERVRARAVVETGCPQEPFDAIFAERGRRAPPLVPEGAEPPPIAEPRK